MSRRLSIVYGWDLLVLSFIKSSILTIMFIIGFFLVFKLYKFSGLSYIFGQCWYWRLFSSAILWKMNFNSCSFFRCFFSPVDCTCEACISYHILDMAMFHLGDFSIGIHKKCKANHYLLLLTILHDLEMHNSGL